MANAASAQAVEVGKERLREFLESSETGRQALAMKGREDSDSVSMNTLDSRGRRKGGEDDDDDGDEI